MLSTAADIADTVCREEAPVMSVCKLDWLVRCHSSVSGSVCVGTVNLASGFGCMLYDASVYTSLTKALGARSSSDAVL